MGQQQEVTTVRFYVRHSLEEASPILPLELESLDVQVANIFSALSPASL